MSEEREVNIPETIGGSSTRKYLNQHVTKELLNGMRKVALEKPVNPLKFLGEYLLEKSKELETETPTIEMKESNDTENKIQEG